VIQVKADQSIIGALEEAGLDLLYDCQRGDCGICQCDVISGEPDHRDIILTDEEKASNTVMQICVSRAKSKRLVIDI
jgi:vanillate O-demethylase ferredoxin subunit